MPDKAPGCSFVWSPRHEEVRDLRLYIELECRGQGYGHLIVSFTKAFFFPFVSSASGSEQGVLQIPFGSGGLGSQKPLLISVLPVTTLSRKFYRDQGFVSGGRSENKWMFQSPEIRRLYSRAVAARDWTFGLCATSTSLAANSEIDALNLVE